eukprot:scaffold8827_cov120-Skeletonema_dohrnii-CCMP3373.AAC.8
MDPKMMPSSPSKVFDQVVDAKTVESPDRQRSISSMELAPPSSASLSPNKSTSIGASAPQPLPLSPNGKLFSHVEKADNPLPAIMKKGQQQQQSQSQHPPTPTSATAMQDTVERIVNAVENRDASSRESALANGTSSQQQILEVTHGGPFTSTELSQLALLCTTGFSSSSSKNGAANQSASSQWAAVDGDLLASLTPLLRAHVTSAMRVDLVGEGLGVIAKTVKAESSPEKTSRPVITIHQVRV